MRAKFANIIFEGTDQILANPELVCRTDGAWEKLPVAAAGANAGAAGANAGAGEGTANDPEAWLLKGPATFDFSTYFNALPAAKLVRYTGAWAFFLHIQVKGAECIMHQLAVDGAGVSHEVGDGLRVEASDSWVTLDLPFANPPELALGAAFAAFTIEALGDVQIRDAFYVVETPAEEPREVRLAICTTTYQKDEYILRNIAAIKRDLLFCDNVHLYVVDNGRTLDAEGLSGDGVTVIPNINAGGSGGFARGMMAALAGEGTDGVPSTHVLLMDDDVAVCTESIKRTCVLLSLAAGVYANAFVSGAMLDYDDGATFYEDMGYMAGTTPGASVKGPGDMTKMAEVVGHECGEPGVGQELHYAGWWYCCIPTATIKAKGLPLPFFVRFDDVEYSLRCQPKTMMLSGICIWHKGFGTRYNPAQERYQAIRNAFAMRAISNVARQFNFVDWLTESVQEELKKYDYDDASVALDGFADFLRGPKFLMIPENERRFMAANRDAERMVPFEEIADECAALGVNLDSLTKEDVEGDDRRNVFQAAMDLLTFNGQRMPQVNANFLEDGLFSGAASASVRASRAGRADRVAVISQGWGYPAGRLHRADTLVVVDLPNRRAAIRRRDNQRFAAIRAREKALLADFEARRGEIEGEYRAAASVLTSEAFWRSYLDLDGARAQAAQAENEEFDTLAARAAMGWDVDGSKLNEEEPPLPGVPTTWSCAEIWAVVPFRLARGPQFTLGRVHIELGHALGNETILLACKGAPEPVAPPNEDGMPEAWNAPLPLPDKAGFMRSPVELSRSFDAEKGTLSCDISVFYAPDATEFPLQVQLVTAEGSFLDVVDEAFPQVLAFDWETYTENAFNGKYEMWLRTHEADQRELSAQRRRVFDNPVTFSIVMPLYRTPLSYLKEAVDSVLNQTYPYWQLVLVNASPDDAQLTEAVREYAAKESRINVVERANSGIVGNTNAGINEAACDFVAFMDHDDKLAPDALFAYAMAVGRQPDIDFLYCDEDFFDDKHYFHPLFKPSFNLDLLRTHNYVVHFHAIRRSLLRTLELSKPEVEAAQDYDITFKACERARRIKHIGKVLYHWRAYEGSTSVVPGSKPAAQEAGRIAVQRHLDRICPGATVRTSDYLVNTYRVKYPLRAQSKVSVVIPNRDQAALLERCIASFQERAGYDNYEIVIVENNSAEPATFELYDRLQQDDRIRVVTFGAAEIAAEATVGAEATAVAAEGFNFSRLVNFGVSQSDGEYVLLLNNDTQAITRGFLRDMLACLQRPEVGVVGTKLLYADGSVQHAGVIVTLKDSATEPAQHVFKDLPATSYGYHDRSDKSQCYSAVTGACQMFARADFDAVGGYDEQLAVAFNDVDFCLKIRRSNKLVVYLGDVRLYHFESVSRGRDDQDDAKRQRAEAEAALFRARWTPEYPAGDPYYNENFDEASPYCKPLYDRNPSMKMSTLRRKVHRALVARQK